ncbi:hypothetical protein C0J52_11405 [Blattella germanica]|nr:hypothetical protein C0J52_11405 [Blattella germanica]
MEFPNDIIRPKYLKNPNINVISVDYSLLVHQECLANAPNNLKYVANCTAQLIDALVNKTIDKDKIHLIGFDFGAQVAGQVSNFLSSGKVHRITESITSEKGFWAHKCKCFVPPKPPLGPPPIRTTEAPTNDTTPPKHTCNEWEGWITEYYKPTLKSTPLNMIALDEGTNSSAEAIVTSLRCPFGETEFALIAECPERGPEEEKDLEIMGESASEAARGVYKVRTRFKPPFARGNPSEEKKDKKNG